MSWLTLHISPFTIWVNTVRSVSKLFLGLLNNNMPFLSPLPHKSLTPKLILSVTKRRQKVVENNQKFYNSRLDCKIHLLNFPQQSRPIMSKFSEVREIKVIINQLLMQAHTHTYIYVRFHFGPIDIFFCGHSCKVLW